MNFIAGHHKNLRESWYINKRIHLMGPWFKMLFEVFKKSVGHSMLLLFFWNIYKRCWLIYLLCTCKRWEWEQLIKLTLLHSSGLLVCIIFKKWGKWIVWILWWDVCHYRFKKFQLIFSFYFFYRFIQSIQHLICQIKKISSKKQFERYFMLHHFIIWWKYSSF